jgi:hypothetical protein
MSDNGDSPIDVDQDGSDGEEVKPKREDTGVPRKRVCLPACSMQGG